MSGVEATPRVVLVTGGTKGIGLACSKRFASMGDIVYAGSRSGVIDEPVDNVRAIKCDVSSTGSVEDAFAAIEEESGPVEVLVSNAAITADQLSIRMKDEEWDSVLNTNLSGSFRAARRAATKMLRLKKGSIIFVSSVAGSTGQAGQANYAASKAGLVGLARSMARELASRSITVNVIAPGPTDTEMLNAIGEDNVNAMVRMVPLGRVADPDEIAAAAEFLASQGARYITGTVLRVDGGLGMAF